jgi:ribose transport system substrate-binding protein
MAGDFSLVLLSNNNRHITMTLLRVLSATAIGLALAACGQSNTPSVTTTSQPAAAAPAPVKKEIGLVMKTLINPFFIEMEKGARRAEQELGISLKVKTAAQETSIEQQIQLVEDLIAAKIDAIVIAPGDSQRLIPTLKKAADAGIKIINIDNRLDPETVKQAGMAPIAFVSVDNDAGAYKAGKFLAEGVTAPTEAAILEGIRSADNARQRMEGARRALLENKNIKVVASESANWNLDEAYATTKAMFAKHPNIKIVFAANDMMAIGAAKYLQESGKGSVKLAGYDALDEAIAGIKAGHMVATVDQQASEQGYQGVVLALKLLQGASVPANTTIDTRLVSSATLK